MRAQTVTLGSIADRPWEREERPDGRPFTDVEEAFFEAEPEEMAEAEPAEPAPATWQAADVELDPPRRQRPTIEPAPPRWKTAELALVRRPPPRRERAVEVDYRPPVVRRAPRLPVRAPVRGGLMSRGTLGLVAGLAVGAGIWLAASRLTARPAPFDLARVGAEVAQAARQLAPAAVIPAAAPAPVPAPAPSPSPSPAPASAAPMARPAAAADTPLPPSIPALPALPEPDPATRAAR